MGVNISAKFGKNDELFNGLASIAEQLIDSPHDTVTAVVTLRTKFVKEDYDNGGAATPTVKVVQIEPLFASAAEKAIALQKAAYQKRTGNPMEPTLFDSLGEPDDSEDDQDDDEEQPAGVDGHEEAAAVPAVAFSGPARPAGSAKAARPRKTAR